MPLPSYSGPANLEVHLAGGARQETEAKGHELVGGWLVYRTEQGPEAIPTERTTIVWMVPTKRSGETQVSFG